ncbi:MAG: DEAD/DEAH box helicase, partial [Planctomycetaceae bacterium]|nr:DEAD/DEAH box helicase [Planctomycetaceae bacterium]
MLELTGWMADRWMARRGDVLEAVLPAGVRLRRRVKRVPVLVVTGEQGNRRPTVNQKKILDAAIQPTPLDVLLKETGVSRSVVNRLLRTGMIIESGSIERDSESDSPESDSVKHNVGGDELPVLSVAQEKALQAILYPLQHGTHETIVLFGVTGSGKTEVYLQAVTETIARGQQAIVLVPEISLTPQTCDRFRSRFGKVAVLHSHLTPAERHDHWREIAAGRVSVIVGARSAIFAPAPRLGLIVIDEEHENTFKQATSPRYHARDVAEWIAQKEGVPLVLGS